MTYKNVRSILRDNEEKNLPLTKRLESIFDAIAVKLNGRQLKEFNNYCTTILDALDLFLNGERYEAFQLLFSIYFAEDNQSLDIFELEEGEELYRMRCVDHYTQFSPEEMYHIPFQLRSKVGNERYSVSGLPSFYLGSSVYDCWEETKRQNIDYSNVAIFTISKNLSFVNMILPDDDRIIKNYSKLPLIIACQLKAVNTDEKFIPEYIIPQLIMDCLIHARKGGKSLCGIRYESNFQNSKDLIFPYKWNKNLFVNYVVPPFEISEEGVCPKIKELFHFNGVTSYAEIKMLNIGLGGFTPKDQYQRFLFGLIEDKLKFLKAKEGMLTYHGWRGALATS